MSSYRKYVAFALAGMFALSLLVLVVKVVHRAGKGVKAGPSRTCATCGRSLPYEDAKCGYCDYVKRMAEFNPQSKLQVVDRELTPMGKVGITSIVLGLLTALAYYPEIREVRKRWARAREESLVVRCKKCKRKLRYPASNAGKQGACPGCRATLTFPGGDGLPVPAAEPAPSA